MVHRGRIWNWSVASATLTFTALGAAQAHASQLELVQVNRIFMGDLFNSSSALGSSPISVAYDGSNIYVGGWNGAGTGTIGIAKISDYNGTFGTATATALSSTIQSSPASRGFDALAWDDSTGSLYSGTDNGTAGVLTRYNSTITGTTWTRNVARVFGGMAIDPVGDPTTGGPVLAYLTQGQGRRLAVSLADGSDVYTITGGSNPGAIINTTPTTLGATWRSIDFDAEGNIALTEDSGYAYGVRTGANSFAALDGTASRTTSIATRLPTSNNPLQGITILEGLGPDGDDLVAFIARSATTLTDQFGNTTSVVDSQVYIRNIDGSITGLTQTALTGSESGLSGAWTGNAKNLAFGYDALTGAPTLVVVDYLSNRLDVYQVITSVPEPASLSLLGLGTMLIARRRRHA